MKLLNCVNKKINGQGLVCKITSKGYFVVIKNSCPIIFMAIEEKLNLNKIFFHNKNSEQYKKKYPNLRYGIITLSKLNKNFFKQGHAVDSFKIISPLKTQEEICKILHEEIVFIFEKVQTGSYLS